ncbi:MAG: hypothetical protein IT449_08180 [Phycisphaerales bacterium]|nr:hypothetical protein [Phycisphaerales bacterium]
MLKSRDLRAWVVLTCGTGLALMLGLLIGCPGSTPPPDNANDNANGNSGLTGKYVGASKCSECHVTIHEDWTATLHAGALETLEAIGQGANAACLGCHTVGFGEEGGFVDRATTNGLAGVQCENCHGPGGDHVNDIGDESKRPTISISSNLCGTCHQGEHHPNFEQWEGSGHAALNETLVEEFAAGAALNNCGNCHSGDFRYLAIINEETVADDYLAGRTAEEMTPITCAICHDPHAQTGNAPLPEDGRDYQLRYPEIANPTPSNTIEDATNKERFNLCGQCHHDRGRTWQTTSRPTHPSNQANVYVGEMPLPDEDSDVLVLSRVSVHSFAAEQCATCHMYRQDFESEEAPAISGHDFGVNTAGCVNSGCHPNEDQAVAVLTTLQTEIQSRLDDIRERLGDPAEWEYVANGGPDEEGQALISDEVKQIRFLYYYALEDGSLGLHNPDYVRDMLEKADELLTGLGL